MLRSFVLVAFVAAFTAGAAPVAGVWPLRGPTPTNASTRAVAPEDTGSEKDLIEVGALTRGRLTPSRNDPGIYLVDGLYQRGEARLARMRRNGELPDTLRVPGCHFDLAGDIGVAYYVRSCP